MRDSDLDYELPAELIAQVPPPERGDSDLLVVRAGSPDVVARGRFADLIADQLRADDLVVANDSRVLHARVHARRPGGGAAELLLLAPAGTGDHDDRHAAGTVWTALARPARRLRPGMQLTLDADGSSVTCVERAADGAWLVLLPVHDTDVEEWLLRVGEVPLPPYIEPAGQDPSRYQTVHARDAGSVAAPTAGLHFSDELWEAIRARCEVALVTLHVGAGTFQTLREGRLDELELHGEQYHVPPATDAAVRAALAAGRRIVAVGTTTTRVLEHVYAGVRDDLGVAHRASLHGSVGGSVGESVGESVDGREPTAAQPVTGSTALFIMPGHEWSCVGALLTNFHLPRSSLLALVMAFGGVSETRRWYEHAVADGMRFYSFGDAMFIHGPPVGRPEPAEVRP